jgi:hypothetical protein
MLKYLPEPVGDRVGYSVVEAEIDGGVYFADVAAAAAGEETALGVEVLGFLEISEDIILFVDEGGVDGTGPEGEVDKGVLLGFAVVIEFIDPGTVHVVHARDEPVDRVGVIAIFQKRVLHAGFTCFVLIDIGEGICDQFEGYPVEGAVGEFDGEGFFVIGFSECVFDAVEGGVVAAVVFCDVESCAGGGCCY